MPYSVDGEALEVKGHSRNRSEAAKGSTDTSGSSKSKDKSNKPPSQKAMLSRALQKANTAVQLDNAQNFESARESYAEACGLLQQVLSKTSTEEDKRKLEAIRRTYTSRIEELDLMAPIRARDDKALPSRPESLGHLPPATLDGGNGDTEEAAVIETATLTRILRDGSRIAQPATNYAGSGMLNSRQPGIALANETPPSSVQPGLPTRGSEQYSLQSAFSRSPVRDRNIGDHIVLRNPATDAYMPPPLSPRRPLSPPKVDSRASPDVTLRSEFSAPSARNEPGFGHGRNSSRESNSWLDPIDESGGSTTSSVHSRSSSMGIRRKHIRAASGATEAEFDAALDAAVEAAYDDGFEPMDLSEVEGYESDDEVVAKALRKVELAKERVRQTEREVYELASEREKRRLQQEQQQFSVESLREDFYDDDSSEEEERILEEMTRGYAIEDFAFGTQVPQAVPRESDSSGVTTRTWHSSTVSNTATVNTVSSVVTELAPASNMSKSSSPVAPPPAQSLPQLPSKSAVAGVQSLVIMTEQSVRNRRLSGQNPKQLKIETSTLGKFPGSRQVVKPEAPASLTEIGGRLSQDRQAFSADVDGSSSSMLPRRSYSPSDEISPSDPTHPASPRTYSTVDGEDLTASRSGSPSAFRPELRKIYSSSSLRSVKSRNMSVSNLDDASDMSPGTPLSTGFGPGNNRLPPMPTLPTPLAAAFREKTSSGSAGGLYLFDDNFHSPNSPGSPNPLLIDAPAPLEPCPTDYLLRPFWLMRCLYQTLAHPRGGYLSNKLFVPRDVWKVKGVRLRNIEDKVGSCDVLTAALLKLAQADTCDADAVLEEMQSLEGILEQVQINLSRKLGTEVGVQSSGLLFRDASNSVEIEAAINVPRSGSVSGKPSSFSWRRLRSKNSAVGLGTAYNSKPSSGDGGKESPGPEILPMTTHPTSRPTKRDVSNADFTGPNANYMGSLARLFDAAQTIDQIARQVEDPGLRHADKTQVGLELCTRHAAEFFGFFICRFVLADLSILLDKFIKRGSEWVLA